MELDGFITTESRLTENGAARIFAGAVVQYAIDARDALNWKTTPPDEGEALDDLTSDCRLLAYLCDQCDLNLDYTTRKITEYVNRKTRR